MHLLLIRHADAGDRKAWDGDDADRPLSDEGRRQASALADALKARGLSASAVVTSPYVRTRQTAELVAAGWLPEGHEPVDCEYLTPDGFRKKRLVRFLHEVGGELLVVVAHAPSIDEFAGWLLGTDGEAVEFEKGGAALLTFDGPIEKGGGTLRWMLTPEWYLPPAAAAEQHDEEEAEEKEGVAAE